MAKQKQGRRLVGVLVIYLLIVIPFLIILKMTIFPNPIPILDARIYDWKINLYDNSEVFFDYWLYNYGEVEAKGVKVICGLYDENYNLLGTATDYVGNVASQSVSFEEATMRTPIGFGVGDISNAICLVKSSDNGEILYEKIPELVEDVEESGLR